ncbi:uncharacterized protein TNCV_768531 [Trichonephila clavipes]|nr:uncharacterized protein TNCV_768531 [Trichonephila clavipes]
MDEPLKALLEGINALKKGQEETRRGQEEMQERMEKVQQEIRKGLEDMQKSQVETKNELKERMKKGLENVQTCQEEMKNSLEEKIDSVEEKIALKVEEKIAVVEENIEKKVEEEIERIKEQDLEKRLLVSGNKNESKILPSSLVPVSTSPWPVTASTVAVKLWTYDGKTNWEVYKTQFSIISEVNGWTEGVKACQLAASLRGEAAEILQTLPETERLNLNSFYNALDLRFGQKYSKDYALLKMKTKLQKTGESLQEYTSEVERLANLAFSNHPATMREVIFLQYFVDGLKEGEIQKAVRMADVQNLKSVLLYALKLEAVTQASRKDRHSIRGVRVTADEPCESRLLKEMEKLKEEMQTIKAGISNQEKRDYKCLGCGGTGHLRRNCPRARKEENTVLRPNRKTNIWPSRGAEVAR